jgi:5'-3' exonuclease
MVEFEADDAIATATARWGDAPGMEQVVICSPDKDMTQLVRGGRVVCLDRRRRTVMEEAGVHEKFGVWPASIPDYLALVGDSADGIPGIPRWGAKTTALVLDRYHHIEQVPDDWNDWEVSPRGGKAVAASLAERRGDAMLYKELATLRLDVPISEDLERLEWQGAPKDEYQSLCAELGLTGLAGSPHQWR